MVSLPHIAAYIQRVQLGHGHGCKMSFQQSIKQALAKDATNLTIQQDMPQVYERHMQLDS